MLRSFDSDFTYTSVFTSVFSFRLKSIISAKAQLEGVLIKPQVRRDTDEPGQKYEWL